MWQLVALLVAVHFFVLKTSDSTVILFCSEVKTFAMDENVPANLYVRVKYENVFKFIAIPWNKVNSDEFIAIVRKEFNLKHNGRLTLCDNLAVPIPRDSFAGILRTFHAGSKFFIDVKRETEKFLKFGTYTTYNTFGNHGIFGAILCQAASAYFHMVLNRPEGFEWKATSKKAFDRPIRDEFHKFEMFNYIFHFVECLKTQRATVCRHIVVTRLYLIIQRVFFYTRRLQQPCWIDSSLSSKTQALHKQGYQLSHFLDQFSHFVRKNE